MSAVIRYSDYHIPNNSLSIDEYVEMLSDSFFVNRNTNRNDLAGFFKNYLGIERVHIEERKNEPKNYCAMLERYFTNENIIPEEIDFLIYTGGNPVAVGHPWCFDNKKECINVPY